MDKQIVVYPSNGILSNENEWTRAACHSINKSQCTVVIERNQTLWFYLHNILKRGNLKGQKTYQWLPEAGSNERGWQQRGTKENIFWSMELLYLDCGGGYTTVYICQNLQNCALKVKILPYVNYTEKQWEKEHSSGN